MSPLKIILVVFAALLIFVIIQLAWVKYNGSPVGVPNISRQPKTIGQGPALTYVVMGDSTAVGQGGDYARGYATKSAEYLAANNTVTWVNVAQSGARARDVANSQLAQAAEYHPDIVLIAVGANDVTHLGNPNAVRDSLAATIAGLRKANSQVAIVLTGSPDMGSIPRFAQPLRWYMSQRTKQLNAVLRPFAAKQGVTFAPVAAKTGPVFRQNPRLFAADKFHPNSAGYDVWTPVIILGLSEARLQSTAK